MDVYADLLLTMNVSSFPQLTHYVVLMLNRRYWRWSRVDATPCAHWHLNTKMFVFSSEEFSLPESRCFGWGDNVDVHPDFVLDMFGQVIRICVIQSQKCDTWSSKWVMMIKSNPHMIPYSAGGDFKRQNLTSKVDPRTERVDHTPKS